MRDEEKAGLRCDLLGVIDLCGVILGERGNWIRHPGAAYVSRRQAGRSIAHGIPIKRNSNHLRADGSPVGGGAWSSLAGGPSSSVKTGFSASAQT